MPYCFLRSSVKFQGHTAQKSSVLTQSGCFRTLTPVWIQWWLWNDAQSLKQHRRGALLFFKVIWDKKSPLFTRIERFRDVTLVLIYCWLSNDAQSLKQHRRGALLFFKVICQISRSHGTKKIADFYPNWGFLDCNSILYSPIALKWCTELNVA